MHTDSQFPEYGEIEKTFYIIDFQVKGINFSHAEPENNAGRTLEAVIILQQRGFNPVLHQATSYKSPPLGFRQKEAGTRLLSIMELQHIVSTSEPKYTARPAQTSDELHPPRPYI